MTILKKEIRQGLLPFGIWTGATAFLVAVCVFLFPEIQEEINSVSDMFANMGSFSAAFGMDRLSMGEPMGFYGIECGNILGIGGGFWPRKRRSERRNFYFPTPSAVLRYCCRSFWPYWYRCWLSTE